jgi:2-polyprenyl-3-methyl-5-hydroxy-6-metoxy-1,4-benzoquinol methylase
MKVYSPITKREAILRDTVPTRKIIEKYKAEGVDVSDYFHDLETLYVCECPDTAYRFFYPFVEGREEFYADLQRVAGYYPEWKWENEVAARFIGENITLLDIGCGEGFFLDQIRTKKNCAVTGLEFNQKAVEKCREKGIEVYKTSINEFAADHAEKFDAVCLFQVLEHIVEVREFLEAALKTLKKGGILIVGVPNNKPYIFLRDKFCMLNLPPHHTGLWNETSLKSLSRHFDIETVAIEEEAPSGEHLAYYRLNYFKVLAENADSPLTKKFYLVLSRISGLPLIRRGFGFILRQAAAKLSGHSIVTVYRKK